MKIVAIVPIKKNSERVKKKNFKKIKNKPLYRYLLDKIVKCNFDEVYVDSDSAEIKKYCEKKNINFILRKPYLLKKQANGNHLLNYHSKIINADLYFQLFVTAPFLKISTINDCINILKNSKKNDSILTVRNLNTWFWFNKKPINYNPAKLPRSQDAKPVVMETTGLYGIKKKTLFSRKCRIGNKPIFYEVSHKESLDCDTKEDLKLLQYYV